MTTLARLLRPAVIAVGLLIFWQAVVWISAAPPYILPDPMAVAVAWWERAPVILEHAGITALEIVLGLALGTAIGLAAATTLAVARGARPWLLPILVVSQAIPVFALAPLLVLWLGFGLASKVAMAALIIFFPVTAAFYDGLRRVYPLWLDAARTLGCTGPSLFRRISVPAALPALASGLRVATATAPIGAVVGEWVGSSAGLGYLMLHANGRVQTDLMFAALFTLAILSVALYTAMDSGLRRLVAWQPGEMAES